jgi:hypothetical protein
VEGAPQQITFYPAAVAEMGAQVRAVSVDRAGPPRLSAEHDYLLAHERAGQQLAWGELV